MQPQKDKFLTYQEYKYRIISKFKDSRSSKRKVYIVEDLSTENGPKAVLKIIPRSELARSQKKQAHILIMYASGKTIDEEKDGERERERQ